MKLRHTLALMLAPLFSLTACGTATTPVDCGSGESFEADGESYCVYRSPITEEGFSCPTDLSTARRIEGLVVCSSGGGEVPSELFDAIPGWFPDETLPTGDCANVLCDLDKVCSDGACAVPQTEEACFEACGVGCPAPEFWICAEDGNKYCNECIIGCKGSAVAEDAGSCDAAEEACIAECGDGCPEPEFQPCATDGNAYCNGCIIECKGLSVDESGESCSE